MGAGMFHGDIGKDIAQGLLELNEKCIKPAKIPPSELDQTLNIATWNIREFGKKGRLDASIHYIAEIIGQFDLVALVEVRDKVDDLRRLLPILGPYWRVIYSDYMDDSGGNLERIAYVYDQRAAAFTGFVGNAEERRKKSGVEWLPESSWWRKPYMCSFAAGNFDFILMTLHVRWGETEKGRIPEMKMVADWVDRRSNEPGAIDKDIIVMGDFNIPKIGDDLYKALTYKGLFLPDALAADKIPGTNVSGLDKRYDQILYLPQFTKSIREFGGTVNFTKCDRNVLYPNGMLGKRDFTYEMSDHLPLWIQIDTDTDLEQLDQVLRPKKYQQEDRPRGGVRNLATRRNGRLNT